MSPRVPSAGADWILLLPERRRFGVARLGSVAARRLGQGDRLPQGQAGEQAQLQRHFQLLPARGWPMAAITRQWDVGDAADALWLRADPVHLRADMGGARLLAWGNLGLRPEEVEECARALRPMFGDSGFEFSAPSAERWYLRLPRGSVVPPFASPESALGDDVFKHLPEGQAGRRWRALLNESQVVMHNLSFNARRLEAGQVPSNSLWFWGGGELPDAVETPVVTCHGADADLHGLARLAGIVDTAEEAGTVLHDLRHVRDWSLVERQFLDTPLPEGVASLRLDFADGAGWRLRPAQKWRWWRRSMELLGA